MIKKMTLYDMVKDSPRFPKRQDFKEGSIQTDCFKNGSNSKRGEFISFLKSVGVDEHKVWQDIRILKSGGKEVSDEEIASALCQQNIVGDIGGEET